MKNVVAEVAVRGAETSASFGHAIEGLMAVRKSLTDLLQRLAELAPLLQNEMASDAVVATVTQAGEALATALGDAGSAAFPQHCSSAAGEATRALEHISGLARHLRAVSSLTLVTARSLGSSHFDIYCEDLRAMVAAMEEAADTLFSAVDSVREARKDTQSLCESARSRLRQRLDNAARSSEERRKLHSQLDIFMQEVAAHVHDLPAAMAREMTWLVTALQFSDSFAQRVDHIRIILDRTPELGDAALSLAAAQLTALCDDAAEVLPQSISALQQLGLVTRQVGSSIGNKGSEAGVEVAFRAIHSTRSVLELVSESEGEAQIAAQVAAKQSSLIQSKTSEMEERFSRLAATTFQIDLAAINSTLLAVRNVGMQKSLGVLSKDVRGIANDCSTDSQACSTAIKVLSADDGLASQENVARAAAAFHDSLGQSAEVLAAAEQTMSRLSDLRKKVEATANSALSEVTRGTKALSAAADATHALRRLAASMPFDRMALQNAAEQLAPLLAIYTMDRERDVHLLATATAANGPQPTAHAAPQAQPPAQVAGDSEEDLMASILF